MPAEIVFERDKGALRAIGGRAPRASPKLEAGSSWRSS
jgi:hypothetical protein